MSHLGQRKSGFIKQVAS